MNRHILTTVFVAVCLLGACRSGEDNKEREQDANLGDPNASGGGCIGAMLDVTSAHPLDEVHFELEGSDEQDLAVSFFWDDSRRHFPGLVLLPAEAGEGDAQRLTFKVPPHPDGIEGGSLRVQFSGEDGLICPAADFEVLPIAKAPGARERLLEAMQLELDAQASVVGLSRQELIEAHRILDLESFRAKIPAPVTPLVLAQFGLDHPDNPYSLANRLRGEDPRSLEEGYSGENEELDALLAHAGFVEQLEQSKRVLESLEPVRFVEENPGASAAMLGGSSLKIEVADAEDLSRYMNVSIDSCGFVKTNYGDILTVVGLTSGGIKNPLVAAAVSSFGLTGTLILEAQRMKCQLWPGKLENFILEDPNVDMIADANEFDFEQRLAVAKVDAWSRGVWNAELALTVLALQTAGSAKGFKDAGTALAPAAKSGATTKAAKEISEAYENHLLNSTSYIAGQNAEISSKYTEMGDVGPFGWKGIDIRDNRYIMLLSEKGIFREFVCGEERFCFVPVRTGQEQLGFMPDIQKFPAEDLPRANGVGIVRPVTIKLDPEVRRSVKLGEELTIAYEVEADDLRVEWWDSSTVEDPRDVLTDSSITEAEEGRVFFRAPTDPEEYPVVIRATSLSTTGLLDNPYVPTPMAFVVLDLEDEFHIEQDEDCVAPGQQVQLTPVYDEEANPNARVEWETTGGEISEDGLWTAPSRRQTYTIKGTLVLGDGLELVDEVQVIVGECTCWYSVRVLGDEISLNHAQEFGTLVARDRGDGLEPLPGYGLYFHLGTGVLAPGIFSVFLDDSFVEHAPARTFASELLIPPSYLYSPGTTEQWPADGARSWLELTSSEPYHDTKYVQGEGFSVHPYKDEQDRIKHFIMRFRFKTILEHPACMSKTAHDGWKAMQDD